MKKIIISEPKRTVWLQETKQIDLKLEDGRTVNIRRMEDDNEVQTFFFIDGESKKWTNLYDLDSKNELFNLIDLVSIAMSDELFGQGKDEQIDIDELEGYIDNNIR
jgi:hypothetical protein